MRNEAVATARNGGDHLAAERLAQSADLYVEVVLLNGHFWPDAFDQFAATHDLTGSLHEHDQHIQGTRTKVHCFTISEQASLTHLQFEDGFDAKTVAGHVCDCAPAVRWHRIEVQYRTAHTA